MNVNVEHRLGCIVAVLSLGIKLPSTYYEDSDMLDASRMLQEMVHNFIRAVSLDARFTLTMVKIEDNFSDFR
jgi:hypothetical protein